jgi:nucleoside phosphorylase/5'-deoxynucleotidase YfbR-like HD superfamily hydrolase
MATEVDIVVVLALSEEFGGTHFPGFEAFFACHPVSPDRSRSFTFRDADGVLRTGIVHTMDDMGNVLSGSTTRLLIAAHHPKLAVNLGIGGRMSADLRIGDIVAADRVTLYNYRGKHTDSGYEAGTQTTATTPQVVEIARNLKQQNDWISTWRRACSSRLRNADFNVTDLGSIVSIEPRLEVGPIVAVDDVISSDEARNHLLRNNRNFLSVDMESGGFAEACNSTNTKHLILKAISDFADSDKKPVETLSKGHLRAWAMSNAFACLFRILSTFDYGNTPLGDRGIKPNGAESLRRFVVEHYFKKMHRQVDLFANTEPILAVYARALLPFVDAKGLLSQSNNNDALFEDVAAHVSTSEDEHPLRLIGEPGTGKSTFLTMLYVALWKRYEAAPDRAALPILIDLKFYTTPPTDISSPSMWDPLARWQQDEPFLRRIIAEWRDRSIVFLLDGLEEYSRAHEELEREIFSVVTGFRGSRKVVVGFSLNYLGDQSRFRRELEAPPPERVILLRGIAASSAHVAAAVQHFALLPPQPEPDIAAALLERAAHFSLDTLDFQLLSMLRESIKDPRYRASGHLPDFFAAFCQTFLHKGPRGESLKDASSLAFRFSIKGLIPTSNDLKLRAWKLLHIHPVINDFLVANHAVLSLQEAGRNNAAQSLIDFEFVYPYRVNKFCKAIVKTDPYPRQTQHEILEGAKAVYERGGQRARPHVCYMVGRLDEPSVKREALQWLQDCELSLRSILDGPSPPSTTDLLLGRTIYISLANLGDKVASKRYLDLLVSRKDWNRVNRGFHREYYGDIRYEPHEDLSHDDDVDSPFALTYEHLTTRIRKNWDNQEYGLFEIEVFTLFSLAQHRHAGGKLPDLFRWKLVELAAELNGKPGLSGLIRAHLDLMQDHLSRNRFRIADILFDFDRLSTTLRAGWVDRKLPLKRVESVAEHTMRAMSLADVLLPEKLPGFPAYDKKDVIELLRHHDLAEIYTGDIQLRLQDVSSNRKEAEAFLRLRVLYTYDEVGVSPEIYERLRRFKERRIGDVSATIAYEIDKLDNLRQLYTYGLELGESAIVDFREWEASLVEQVETEVGKKLLRDIRDSFQRSED